MGDSDREDAGPAAGTSIPSVFRHDDAHTYPNPWGRGFSGRLGDRKHPFLLPHDLPPPHAARPRVLIPRLRKAGPKLHPEDKAFLVARNAERALIAQREKGFPTDIVIAFVEDLDKAHQYARFNNYLREKYGDLKHDTVPDDLSYKLIKDNERTHDFSLLDDFDIGTLVDAYVRELVRKHYVKGYELEAEQPVDGSIRDPVYYLEFRAREEGYVLDENPEAELKKLKKFAPTFYRNHFVCRKSPVEVEARTVTVSNIAFNVHEKIIREFFMNCGIITCAETESTPECQIAHITYKDLEGAERAQTYTGFPFPELSKLIKPLVMCPGPLFPRIQPKGANISPTSKGSETSSSCESPYAPLLVQRKSVQGANGAESPAVKTEDVSSMHAKALQRYSELRTYYSQYHSKHVEAAEKGRGYGRCRWMDWMTIEGISNGGYTVGGQKLHPRSKAS